MLKNFRPELVIEVFNKRFKLYWKMISMSHINSPGRPPISAEVTAVIKKMYLENIKIGGLRIYMNLKYLGFKVSLSTVYRKLREIKKNYPDQQSQHWKTFLYNSKTVAMDFLTVSIEISRDVFREMFIFIIIEHGQRKVLHYNCTTNPSQEWVIQQFRNTFNDTHSYEYMVHDRDATFMHRVKDVLPQFGLASSPTAPRSPWQNAFVESFNGTLRRELFKHIIFKDEFHLRSALSEYIDFYNHSRMHSGLMDSPVGMEHYAKPPPKNILKNLRSTPVLNGLHHVYSWKDAA